MTQSGHTGQNLVGGLRPREGLRLFIRVGDVGPDRVPERLGIGMHPAPHLFLREQGNPALDQIQPGGAGRRKVDMEAWALQQPPSDHGGLMRPIVVEGEMHVQLCRDRHLNRIEERAEFTAALPLGSCPITWPVFTFKAANSEVVPWRR